MTHDTRRNPVLASLSVLYMAVLWGLPFLQIAPNRLVSGQPIYFFSIVPAAPWLLVLILMVTLLALTVTCFFKPSRALLVAAMLLAVACIACLLWLAASQATTSMQNQSTIARASLGSAFWLVLVLLGFTVSSALQQSRASALQSAAMYALLVLALSAILASGVCADLSLIKEFTNRADGFLQLVAQHLQIVLIAMACALAIGLPLGWAAYARPAVGRLVFAVLNIIQTIPSIALFGLLMLPLALLAASLPVLGRAGISGVGLAPAVIALSLYALLPVVRSTHTGLQRVPRATVQAAFALGLTRPQVLLAVEVPLALPVVLGGVRTAAVATVGLAAVSALIGAGGLGSILFEGLFANAQDLVLLGVLPIIALGLLADMLFKVLTAWARLKAHPQR